MIEKPLSHILKGIKILEKTIKRNNLTVMIGYQMRFHPCYKLVDRILSKKIWKYYFCEF